MSTFGFARDHARVYFYGKEVLEADPANFRLLHCNLYRDDDHAWYEAVDATGNHVMLKMIAGADIHTFTVDPHTCKARDAKKEYPYGKFSS